MTRLDTIVFPSLSQLPLDVIRYSQVNVLFYPPKNEHLQNIWNIWCLRAEHLIWRCTTHVWLVVTWYVKTRCHMIRQNKSGCVTTVVTSQAARNATRELVSIGRARRNAARELVSMGLVKSRAQKKRRPVKAAPCYLVWWFRWFRWLDVDFIQCAGQYLIQCQ